jgi:hypothetical protein
VTEQPGLELALDLDAKAHAGRGRCADRPARSRRLPDRRGT